MALIELKRDGHAYEMERHSLSMNNIALVFGLDPHTIFLKEPSGNRCYFPGDDQTFTVGEHSSILLVDGNPSAVSSRTRPLSVSAMDDTHPGPSSRSVVSNKSSYNVKVARAEKHSSDSGRVEFTTFENMYVEINASTANIAHVTSCVQKKWGKNFIIVSKDGLEIGDCSATQGLKFWKVPSRKLFAIERRGSKRKRYDDDDDDDPSHKMLCQLSNIDKKLTKIMEVTPNLNLPIGFISLLHESFTCCVCKVSPMIPPIIFARCCKSILGCQRCIDRWYRGEPGIEKRCPLCRGERGLADTTVILGLDNFLVYVDKWLNNVPPPPSIDDLPSDLD